MKPSIVNAKPDDLSSMNGVSILSHPKLVTNCLRVLVLKDRRLVILLLNKKDLLI